MSKLRFIMMTCGYVESSKTSVLIYQCEYFGHPGYDTHREAISELALDMYAKYYDDYLSIYENRYSSRVKLCCTKSLIANKQANYCSECGSHLNDKQFTYEDFAEYIMHFHDTDCNNYGEAEQTSIRTLAWWPWQSNSIIGASKDEVVYIAECAEEVLLAALLDVKPELKDEEFECNDWERFKNGNPPTYR